MKNFNILKAKLADPTIAALADETARLNALNAKSLPHLTPITTHDIKVYLILVSAWRAIKDSTLPSALNAIDAIQGFKSFDITDINYLNKLKADLDELVADSLITSQDKTAILALGDNLQSWSDQSWSGDVTLTDISNARSYT